MARVNRLREISLTTKRRDKKAKMAKLLKAKDRILLGLALLGDAWDDVRLVGGLVTHLYSNFYGWTPVKFRKQSFYESISRMVKTGYIEKIIKNNKPYLRLLSAGKKKLIRDFPILELQGRKWDGFWTIVVFDIAEISRYKRDLLRRKLLEIGFGMYQRSVYISPFDFTEDLKEFIEHYQLPNVQVFRAKEMIGERREERMAKIWPLEKLNEGYEKIIEKAEEIERLPKGKPRENKLRQLRNFYLDILLSDPFLPKELLPKDWLGEKARKIVLSFA